MPANDDFTRLAGNHLRYTLQHLHHAGIRLGRADGEHAIIDLVGELDHHTAIDRNDRHIRHRLGFFRLNAVFRGFALSCLLQVGNELLLRFCRLCSFLQLRLCCFRLGWCGRRSIGRGQVIDSLARPVIRAERIAIGFTAFGTRCRTGLRGTAIALGRLVLQNTGFMSQFREDRIGFAEKLALFLVAWRRNRRIVDDLRAVFDLLVALIANLAVFFLDILHALGA